MWLAESGIQRKLSSITYSVKGLPTANANLEYHYKAQTFKHREQDLEALNGKILESVSITGA